MTTYNKASYSTTTPINVGHGRLIYADNQDLYANNEEYYSDGSVVMRNVIPNHPVIKCNNTVIKCNDKGTVLCNGCLPYVKETHT